MDSENKYVKRAKRVEKRINNYSQNAESLIINSIDLIQDFLIDLSSKSKKIDKVDSEKKEMNYLRGKLMMNINEDFGTPIDSDVVKNPMDYASDRRDDGGSVKMFYNSYSSSEAKKVVEGRLKEYVQQLRKLEGKFGNVWMINNRPRTSADYLHFQITRWNQSKSGHQTR